MYQHQPGMTTLLSSSLSWLRACRLGFRRLVSPHVYDATVPTSWSSVERSVDGQEHVQHVATR